MNTNRKKRILPGRWIRLLNVALLVALVLAPVAPPAAQAASLGAVGAPSPSGSRPMGPLANVWMMTPPNLVSWWHAEGNANDSADGNNGTLQNGATFGTGRSGQAFSFDGVDDYVNVPDADNSIDPGSCGGQRQSCCRHRLCLR